MALREDLSDIVLRSLCTIDQDKVKAVSIEWHSWLWQLSHMGGQCHGVAPAVGPFLLVDSWEPIHKMASRAAWWSLGRSFLEDIAAHLGIAVAPGSTLLQLLVAMVQWSLMTSDEETMNIVYRRLATEKSRTTHSRTLVEADDAHCVMVRYDQQKLRDRQDSIQKELEVIESFSKENTTRRQAFRAGVAAAGNKKGARGKQQVPAKVVIPHHCAQADAKLLVPPNTSIWRSLVRSKWSGHCKDHKRVTEPFLRHNGSSQDALKACLRALWIQHSLKEGIVLPAGCPVEGLFVESGASSSSS